MDGELTTDNTGFTAGKLVTGTAGRTSIAVYEELDKLIDWKYVSRGFFPQKI